MSKKLWWHHIFLTETFGLWWLLMFCVAWCPNRHQTSILLPLVPPSYICYFPLIAGANSWAVWKFKSNNTTTLTRRCCNPLILRASMVRKIHEFQARKTFWGAPNRRLDFCALLPALRPRAIVVLGVHRGAFGEQKLRSRDAAVDCRPVQRRVASGGFPGAVGREAEAAETTKVEQSWAPSRSTDKRTMNVSGINIFKSVQNKKHSQTHWTSFNTS